MAVKRGTNRNDVLNGTGGLHTLYGFAGNDTYIVDQTGDRAIEAAGRGIDHVKSTATYTLSANVEKLTLLGATAINGTGNASANTLTGNAKANSLRGLANNDILSGLAGNDTIDGGTGIDTMRGGLGNDVYIVDHASDRAIETPGQGIDHVKSTVTYTLSANVENLTLLDIGAINGTGNASANTLTGNNGANSLRGLEGNDTLLGNGGNDDLIGGLGNDTIRGGTGIDTGKFSGLSASYDIDPVAGGFEVMGPDGTDFVASDVELLHFADRTIDLRTNNAALITGLASGTVDEDAVTTTATGDLGATDVDNSDDTFQAVSVPAATTNGYGTYTVTAAGVWTFTLDNANATVNALNDASPSLTDTFTVLTQDGTAQVVTITITGTNDATLISGLASGTVDEDAVTTTATGDLGATDLDNPADTFQAVLVPAATTNGYGTYTVTAAGVWTFTLDNANATVNALNDASTPLTDSFTVLSADGTPQVVTVTITGTNDSPQSLAVSLTQVVENLAGALVGNLSVLDPDTGDAITYTIRPGLDGSLFAISGNELRIGATGLDYETSTTRSLTVRATDGSGAFVERTFVIDVLNRTLTTGTDTMMRRSLAAH